MGPLRLRQFEVIGNLLPLSLPTWTFDRERAFFLGLRVISAGLEPISRFRRINCRSYCNGDGDNS
jgi:hypothetical protein